MSGIHGEEHRQATCLVQEYQNRVTDRPRSGGTSEDHLGQPFLRKGTEMMNFYIKDNLNVATGYTAEEKPSKMSTAHQTTQEAGATRLLCATGEE